MKAKLVFSALVFLMSSIRVMSQDLESLLESETEARTEVTTGTFKATRLMNGHSIERMQKGQLDFRIDHRFGLLSDTYNAFGLDQSSVHFSLDYGITDWAMVGIGRSALQKTVDGFVKFSPIRQSTGKVNMPVSVSLLLSADMKGTKPVSALDSVFSNNISYTSQLLIARKFSEKLSLQLMPTYVHRNLAAASDPNNVFAVGIGGRYKFLKRVSLNVEYYNVFNKKASVKTYDPLAIGFDIETGGHVFQLFFTNAIWNTERGFLTDTQGSWGNGDVHFGFKISRVFPLIKRKDIGDKKE